MIGTRLGISTYHLYDFSNEFNPDLNLDGSLDTFKAGEKLKDYHKNLEGAIFNTILNNTIFGEESLLLGTEFSELKRRYADSVLGAWDREKSKLRSGIV